MLEILCEARCGCTIVCSPSDIFFVGFKCFFRYIAHMVGLPPSFNHWFVTMYLWLTFGCYGDSLFFVVPMVGKGWFPMMLCGCICVDGKWCRISCLTWINPHFFFVCHLVFVLTLWFWWMVFERWLMSSSLAPFKHIWFCG